MIKTKKVDMYVVRCDNCGRFYEGRDGNELYFDEDELIEDVKESGWLGLYKGKRELDLMTAEQHFCCLRCRVEYLAKKGGQNDDC